MTGQNYSGIRGKSYSSGRELGRGGEGAVFEIKENTSLVIKVYSEALQKEKVEKLNYMASMQDAELDKFAAWPVDVALNSSVQVCGFIMRKLEGFVPLHMLFSPMDRKKLFPDKGYNFLVHVARNLATAFHKIHQSGIVVGDVNEGNILVNASGMVALIDCDSFQIRQGNSYHFCEVGITRYTPPEILEKGTFEQIVRTTNTDSFSLAILIFQLLFLGRHPFTGTNITSEDIDEEKAIRSKEFAYSLRRINKKLSPAKNSFQLKSLTPGIIDLFHQAFEAEEGRPLPARWVQELDTLSKELITCSETKLHLYPKKLQECPWCQFKERAGIVFFLDDNYLKAIPELSNIEQFINGFKPEKIELKKLSGEYRTGNLKASPIEKQFRVKKKLIQLISVLGLIGSLLLGIINPSYIFAGFAATSILYAFLPWRKHLRQELERRKNYFSSLKTQFTALVKQHNTPHDLTKYNDGSKNITKLIANFQALPAEFGEKKKIIEEKHYKNQYQLFLEQFDIRTHPIASFGASKKLLLLNHGVQNAADISKLNTIYVRGIGPKNIQTLLDWQRQMGSAFTYRPDYNAINNEIQSAANDIAIKKQHMEAEIKREYKSLHYFRTNIMSSIAAIEHQHNDLAVKLYQAELDLEIFQKFN